MTGSSASHTRAPCAVIPNLASTRWPIYSDSSASEGSDLLQRERSRSPLQPLFLSALLLLRKSTRKRTAHRHSTCDIDSILVLDGRAKKI